MDCTDFRVHIIFIMLNLGIYKKTEKEVFAEEKLVLLNTGNLT